MRRATPDCLVGAHRTRLIACRLAWQSNPRDHDPRVRPERLPQDRELSTGGDHAAQARSARHPPETLGFKAEVGHAATHDLFEPAGVV